MRENVIIAYRGANYELGQWPHGYGIWSASSQESLPLEWWDPTPDGWSAAWYRFTALEVAGTIVPASQPGSEPESAQPAQADQAGAASLSGTPRPTPFFAEPTASQTQPAGPAAQPGTQSAQPGQSSPQQGWTGPFGGAAAAGGTSAPANPAFAEADAKTVSPWTARIAGSLLAVGVLCGIIGLFPAYLGGASLASQAPNLWPHVLYLAAWAVGAGLVFRGGLSQRVGAFIATGTSAVTLGLFLADIGYGVAGAAVGAGLVLTVAGWLACAVGSVLAFGRWPSGWPRKPIGREATVVGILIAAAIGTAITFAPSWDSYVIASSSGVSETITAGNAFINPGIVILGDVIVMVALVAVIVLAALWRPARFGWALVAGALVPITGQALSALIQVSEPTTAAQIGIPPADVSRYGLTVQSSGLTAAFWLYCVFVIAVIAATAWLAFGRDRVPYADPQGYRPQQGYGAGQAYGPGQGHGPQQGYGSPGGYYGGDRGAAGGLGAQGTPAPPPQDESGPAAS